MHESYIAETEREYKWAGISRLAKWMMASLCADFGYDTKWTTDRLEDTIIQFGLYMDLGQCLINAGERGIKEELRYIYDRYGTPSIRFSNKLKYSLQLPPLEEVWSAYCYRRFALGNHCSGSGLVGSWQVMAGNTRLEQLRSGIFRQAGPGENYLVSSLLKFEYADRKYPGHYFYEDPLMYFISLALILSEYRRQRESLIVFRDFDVENTLFIRDRDKENGKKLLYELSGLFDGMQLQFKLSDKNTVMMWLPRRFWKGTGSGRSFG